MKDAPGEFFLLYEKSPLGRWAGRTCFEVVD